MADFSSLLQNLEFMKTKAIVIKKSAVNEYDQIVTCYSEEFGTLRALARGICRPTSVQSLHLDHLNLVEFELVYGRALPIITGAQVIDQFTTIKGSLARLAAAQFFTEVLDKISFENERDPRLWDLLHNLLVSLNGVHDGEVFAEFRTYQNKFLEVLGYAPQIQRCVVCAGDVMSGPERQVALSMELGGAMCGDCFLASGRGILFDKQELTLDTFFEYTVGQKLNSLTFLYSVLK